MRGRFERYSASAIESQVRFPRLVTAARIPLKAEIGDGYAEHGFVVLHNENEIDFRLFFCSLGWSQWLDHQEQERRYAASIARCATVSPLICSLVVSGGAFGC